MAKDPPVDELSYTDAVAELEQIVDELDDDHLDVDLLAARVQRAAELIRVCRSRIAGARLEIDRVVVELEAEGRNPDDAAEGRNPDDAAEGRSPDDAAEGRNPEDDAEESTA
jgi:exodeoxyribonuclease VII small subunit